MRLNGRISERSLRAALRVRGEAVDLGRQALLEAIAAYDAASEAERAAVEAIGREAQAATGLSGEDLDVEAFVAWLPRGRRAVAAACAGRDEAASAVALARAGLAVARKAEAATEALIAQGARARLLRVRRSEQAALDEAAGRRHGKPGGTSDAP